MVHLLIINFNISFHFVFLVLFKLQRGNYFHVFVFLERMNKYSIEQIESIQLQIKEQINSFHNVQLVMAVSKTNL